MESIEYKFHDGARSSLKIVAVLCFILIVSAPLAVWLWIRAMGGKVVLSPTGVLAKGLGTTRYDYADVARLGTCQVPIRARGIGGALVRRRVGGSHATHVVVKLKDGKKRGFIASSYDNYQDLMAKLSQRLGKPYEKLEVGLIGLKWPE